MLLQRHAVADFLHLELNGRSVVGADPLQALPGLVMPADGGEPAGGLLEREHAQAEKPGPEQLQADGDLPHLGLGLGETSRDAPVDPLTNVSKSGAWEASGPTNTR